MPAPAPPPPTPPDLELWRWRRRQRRRGLDAWMGWLIALQLVPMGLVAMALIRFPLEVPEEPIEMMVLYEIPEPPPLIPEPPVEEPPPPHTVPPVLAPDTVATRRDSQEDGDLILDPRAGVPDQEVVEVDQPPEEAADAAPVPLEDWVPTEEDAEVVRELMSELEAQAKALTQRQKDLQHRIMVAEVQSAARQFDLDSDGGLEGAIRMIDVGKYSEQIVQPIFARYGITTERRYTKPSTGRSFINAAATDKGTFRNVEKEGYFDVMVLSAKAVHFMSTAETEALVNGGFDPRTTRVRKIIFGVIERSGQYELGVVDLEVEKIR